MTHLLPHAPHDPYLAFLTDDCHYLRARSLGNGFYVAIYPLLFSSAIILCAEGDRIGYKDRWDYATYNEASDALDAWDGTGEPAGWIRHPDTGRRRDKDGKEYIRP